MKVLILAILIVLVSCSFVSDLGGLIDSEAKNFCVDRVVILNFNQRKTGEQYTIKAM
jgi:hypothetical protein